MIKSKQSKELINTEMFIRDPNDNLCIELEKQFNITSTEQLSKIKSLQKISKPPKLYL